jgi:hypothetical protein
MVSSFGPSWGSAMKHHPHVHMIVSGGVDRGSRLTFHFRLLLQSFAAVRDPGATAIRTRDHDVDWT